MHRQYSMERVNHSSKIPLDHVFEDHLTNISRISKQKGSRVPHAYMSMRLRFDNVVIHKLFTK